MLSRSLFAIAVLLVSSVMSAQRIPAGTVLPISLNDKLDAKKNKPGEKLEGRLMQDIPASLSTGIKRGARVLGRVVDTATLPGGGRRLTLIFDQIEDGKSTVPLSVSVRAIATSDSVFQAKLPINASSDSVSEQSWVVRQVGGDIVNRARRLVGSGDRIVGRWDGSVWAHLAYMPDCPPRNVPPEEQAMWVFSVDACGVYGAEDQKLTRHGDTDPLGQVTLESSSNVRLGGGSGWLLVVNEAAAPR